MATTFLVKKIDVVVDATTWPRSSGPPKNLCGGVCSVDLGLALHMLGTLTMPNLLSPASPALFWAWLRYYLAPTSASDLRITMDFADLDPHQKGILSDDFGVAIATQWMVDRFGGFRDIVDGRRFALQFPHLLRRKHKSKAKVGPSKTPDFVLCDLTGKWHVLECKGTQSKNHQSHSLKVAVAQKRAISLVGSIKGEQLATALYIANEQDASRTQLKVIDPDDPPLIRLTENRAGEMEVKAHRIAVATALGTIGLSELALELSLPPEVDPESDLLRPSEVLRIRGSRQARSQRASEQARARNLTRFAEWDGKFEGREVQFEFPRISAQMPFRSVVLRQGVLTELIEEISAKESLIDDTADEIVEPFTSNARIYLEAEPNRTALSYGNVMRSEMIWK